MKMWWGQPGKESHFSSCCFSLACFLLSDANDIGQLAALALISPSLFLMPAARVERLSVNYRGLRLLSMTIDRTSINFSHFRLPKSCSFRQHFGKFLVYVTILLCFLNILYSLNIFYNKFYSKI